ncbi:MULTISPECIES: formyltransferase family protein [unclassified Pseudoalteromonas]|uniref:formyltransferase family protein n=1 Tax=unclassified Pseudoalteromonas TaxID=194690 RepID=UPI0018CCA44A|nr:formyltransferase family protein [Pseudoalteromonas sp. NZS100]MBH0067369.1 UDP-glucuronic acid dehydrogenase [Pseudoalteromonas sp. NZS100]|tara:strand:+ start:97 stop:747 length:651 start_codon:yes stop_codon:yes gene_type:complete
MLKVTLICSDENHPVFRWLQKWKAENEHYHAINLHTRLAEINNRGNLLFLVSCSEIVTKAHRNMFQHSLVLHASDLPKNRGWSPHVWSVLNGENNITLSLLEAEDKVDTGLVWKKTKIKLNGTELYDEINQKLFDAELQLISWACKNLDSVTPKPQNNSAANYLPKRTAKDSELDISKSLESQFDLLRVCDPNRFPAFFNIRGCKYKVKIEKCSDE